MQWQVENGSDRRPRWAAGMKLELSHVAGSFRVGTYDQAAEQTREARVQKETRPAWSSPSKEGPDKQEKRRGNEREDLGAKVCGDG